MLIEKKGYKNEKRMKEWKKERMKGRKKERQETKEQQTFFASSGFDEREPNQNQKCLCQDIRKITKQRLFFLLQFSLLDNLKS